ncbi:hypothetical protein [Domibacillus iocasae]|uniref:Uncharacterized protein n=1 Tax=Domibacillus iocasae TaxID=1714016 RepID=A0A1E7DKH9_9BACI|nr:hypothetical protein [Domibacillus iocasae]OES43495.1 hypothetical protein BA724_13840 [Domibacillus iocasae]
MNNEQIERYIDVIMEGMYHDYPELEERFGKRGKGKCREDNHHHFRHLKTAYTLQNDQFFVDYAHWLTNLLVSRGMKAAHVIDNFERIDQVLEKDRSEEAKGYRDIISTAIASIERREAP